jgi:DNA-binding response OmpR family regulator/anti-sigma regulatory factor (Ser/Thr protein kinase)
MARSTPVKILVAEDDCVSLRAIGLVLGSAGYEVVTAKDGLAAWHCLQQPEAPQIAVLNWMMPGLSGLEICQRIRARKPSPVAYLLLLTSNSDPQDIILGLNAGADDYLRKPFNPAELKARLRVGERIVQAYNELGQNVRALRLALRAQERAEEHLSQSETRLRMIMNTVPAGVLVCDGQTGTIMSSNPTAEQCLGLPAEELKGGTYHRFFHDMAGGDLGPLPAGPNGADCQVVSAQGRTSHIRLTQAKVSFQNNDLQLLSFLDISDTRRLMAEQQLNLDQARKLLSLANGGLPRWIGLNDELTLHLTCFAASSQRAGGDHCWARTVPARSGQGPTTLLGLRDQSGHEVNCILRSIATDLFHKEAVELGLDLEGRMAYLNDRLCSSGMFADDDFLTDLTLELDHASLGLRFVSCGHPPMFLIRDRQITALPKNNGPGRNLPLGALAGRKFAAAQQALQPGDRLILFTDGLFELGKTARGTVLSAEVVQKFIQEIIHETPDIPVRKLVQRLLAKVHGQAPAHEAPPDDVTVLGLEIERDAGQQERVFHPHDLQELDRAIQETCERLVSEWQLPADSAPGLRLLLDEALSNAWQHGNQRNHTLPIRVSWGRHNACAIVVEDAGRGFDSRLQADPRLPAQLILESGRGLFLIRHNSEWAEWKNGGRRLVARLAEP